jgi:hypothetical protein
MQKCRQGFSKSRSLWVVLFALVVANGLTIGMTQASTISILDHYTSGIGYYSSIAVLDGKPIISYYDNAHGDLRLAICSNPACSPGTTYSIPIDTDYDVGYHSTVAVSNGNPIIVYTINTFAEIRVAACVDPLCDLPPVITTLEHDNVSVNTGPAIAIINGKPVISYRGDDTSGLHFAVCNDALCTSAVITFIDTGWIGYNSSIAVLDGKPIISYMKYVEFEGVSLHIASCQDATCSAPPILSLVDNNGNVGYSSSITIVDGKPIISYINGDTGDLMVAACVDTTCTAPAVITRIDMAQRGDERTAIININGKVMIAYGSRNPQDNIMLRLATCDNALCTSATIDVLDDSTVNTGQFTSIAEINGYPIISFNDEALLKIKIYYGGDYTIPVVTPTQPPQATPIPDFQTEPTIHLTWGRVDWAKGYEIEIDDQINFLTPILTDDTIPASALEYNSSAMLPNGTYYWHVCAKVNAIACGHWSAPESFTISSAF